MSFTIEFKPLNKAAKTLQKSRSVRKIANRQVMILADSTYGILVKNSIHQGQLNFAETLTFVSQPGYGAVFTKPGFTVIKDQERSLGAVIEKKINEEEVNKGELKGIDRVETQRLIEEAVPRGIDASRGRMIKEFS